MHANLFKEKYCEYYIQNKTETLVQKIFIADVVNNILQPIRPLQTSYTYNLLVQYIGK